jgi:hypothetical protein
MIEKFLYEGNLDLIKNNKFFTETMSCLEKDSKKYYVGLDIASEHSKDCSSMSWYVKCRGGSYDFLDSKLF